MQPENKPEDIKAEVKKEEVKPVDDKQVKDAVPPPPPPVTDEEINWKRFREERARERKEKEETERRLLEERQRVLAMQQALEQAQSSRNQPQAPQQQSSAYDPNDIPTFGQVDQYVQQRINDGIQQALRKGQEEMKAQQAQQEAAQLPQRLTSTYNDFDRVCTAENLDYLEYHYPEVAAAFKNAPDSYDKWANIYKSVKRFVPNIDSKRDMAKAANNAVKPQSMSTPGVTQTGDEAPRVIDDKRKEDNWRRMQRIIKGG